MTTASAHPRFGLLLLPDRLTDFGETCRLAEEAGFDLLGLGDSQSVFREVWVSLTVAALATRRLRLGPLVTNPGTRHAVVTASAVSSLDEVAGGRALLGLGSGDSAIYTLGAPPATVAGLEDAIRTLRALTEGSVIEREGRRWQVHRAHRRIPIYLAAEGPRTLRLAGRLADGVVMGLGLTPGVVRLSLGYLAEGAAEAGRRVEDIDVWWFAKANLADSRAAAVEPIRMALAASANHAFRFTLEGKGVPAELHERIRGLQREYDSHQHEKLGPTGNAALTDRWGLTEYLAERFAIAGTADDCARTIDAAMAAGARQFVLTGIVHDPRQFIERCARDLLS